MAVAERSEGETVLDPMCGAGGNSIAFGRLKKQVQSSDIDAGRLEMAKHNAKLFGVEENISFSNGDALEFLRTRRADVVYLDPPWGGPDYSKKQSFGLADFMIQGALLLESAIKAAKKQVIFKLPKNFNMSELEGYSFESILPDRHSDTLQGYTAYLNV